MIQEINKNLHAISVSKFTVAINPKLQAASCWLDNRHNEHEYKRPTFATPLDESQTLILISIVYQCVRQKRERCTWRNRRIT